jgi:NADH-quinone oxidoreductase subunit E
MQMPEQTNSLSDVEILDKYPPDDASQLIPILQEIQEQEGYLSEEHLFKVARHTSLPVSRIYGVATFYNQFRLKPLGKHVIRVCRGTACHVKGSLDLLTTLENELGVKAGSTTRDGRFTVETVACIGACSIAPVIAIDGEFHGGLTVKSLQKLLAAYENQTTE